MKSIEVIQFFMFKLVALAFCMFINFSKKSAEAFHINEIVKTTLSCMQIVAGAINAFLTSIVHCSNIKKSSQLAENRIKNLKWMNYHIEDKMRDSK